MHSLLILYSALTVFGLGVTIVDVLGFLDHLGSGSTDHGDGDGQASDATNHDHPDSHHGNSQVYIPDTAPDHSVQSGSYINSADESTRLITKVLGILRSTVYFSLGAGPTGLFALLTHVDGFASLLWSAGAGLAIAVIARFLRSSMRKDLDSSIKPEEFLMDLATISVPVQPGAMGKIIVRRYDHEQELYVRAKDPQLGLKKGSIVRIVDFTDDCYWVEPEE